jgi:hypothetical protein
MKYNRQHKQSYNFVNLFLLYYHGKTEKILNYICNFGLTEGKKYNRDAKTSPNQCEQCWGYCSSVYRHMTQPMRNYNYALHIYYWLIEKSVRTEQPFPF